MDSLAKQLIRMELVQRREEGCDVTAIESQVREALADDTIDDAVFVDLYDALDALTPEPSFPYEEPSDLDAIRALRPDGPGAWTSAKRRTPCPTASTALGSAGLRAVR